REASLVAFRTLQEKQHIRCENLPLETVDGQQLTVEFVSNIYGVRQKKVVQCNIRDVTERRRAQLAEQEAQQLLQSTLDALSAHIAVCDETGKIIAVNQAWREFAKENNGDLTSCGVGAGYLGVCDEPKDDRVDEAQAVARGIRDVMAGRLPMFYMEYPCHSPTEERWFRVYVTSYISAGTIRVVVAHENTTDRKLAEDARRAGEERYHNIVANAPGVVYQYVLHPSGRVTIPFVNVACRDLYELEPEELQENPEFLTRIIHPDDVAECEGTFAVSAATLTPWNWEGRICLPSGKTKWVQAAARPQRLPDGGLLWDCLMMDVSARKEAEIERDRFFTLSLDMFVIAGADGYFKRLNPAFEATLGFTNEELMSRPFLEYVHPDDLAATQFQIDKRNNGHGVVQFENRYLCKDGSYKWLRWMSTPFEGLVYAVAHDVTAVKQTEIALHKAKNELELRVIERTAEMMDTHQQLQEELLEHKQTEETLRAAQQMLQLVMNHIPQSIFWKDLNSDFLGCNYRFAHEMGFRSPEEVIGKNDCDTSSAEHAEAYRAADRLVMQTGEPRLGIEEPLNKLDGSTSWLRTNKIPLTDSQGAIMGVLCSYEDITAQKEAETAIHQARDEAERANSAKSEFLSRMSHELRTPLNAILGFGQILEMSNRNAAAQQQDNIRQILKAGQHLLDLINEVLDIARIEAGYLSLSLEPVSVGQMVREALDVLRPMAAGRNIQFIDEVRADCDEQYVLADQQRFKQVLLNFINNAVKYNRDGGSVVVACEVASNEPVTHDGVVYPGRLRISIKDSGPGLAPEDITRLFVAFERLNAARGQVEGTGIGLSLCKHLVEAMKGEVGVESTLGQGSTFWFTLPLIENVEGDERSGLNNSPQPDAEIPAPLVLFDGPRTVLYIEDNLSNINLI
ncbi:MAG TPA: PAS domain S-box protein, partial [Abditibacteriaceae bacterium]